MLHQPQARTIQAPTTPLPVSAIGSSSSKELSSEQSTKRLKLESDHYNKDWDKETETRGMKKELSSSLKSETTGNSADSKSSEKKGVDGKDSQKTERKKHKKHQKEKKLQKDSKKKHKKSKKKKSSSSSSSDDSSDTVSVIQVSKPSAVLTEQQLLVAKLREVRHLF